MSISSHDHTRRTEQCTTPESSCHGSGPVLPVTADQIDEAAQTLKPLVRRTPLERSERLSAIAGVDVWLKREDLQPVRSYKLRGAYLLLSNLSESERTAGVVAASAGNHAQGVAQACQELGIHGRIFVPRSTPRQKRERITAIGGDMVELIVVGEAFDDAAEAAVQDSLRTGATIIPPFDHPQIMAGQGTVAREAIEQAAERGVTVGTVVVPVGGGGLLAGCATWLAAREPDVAVVGVEPAGAASMQAAITEGHPVTLRDLERFVDGAAVRRVGEGPYTVVDALRPRLLSVDEGAVCTEMLGLYQVDGIIAEPAGALAAAAVATGAVGPRPDAPTDGIVVIVSGGNNDVSRYSEVVERSLVHEGLRHYFLVTFPQEPGALRRFLDRVLGPDDDIVLFDYIKRNNREEGPALVGLEIGAKENLEPLMRRMSESNMHIERIDPRDPMYRYLT